MPDIRIEKLSDQSFQVRISEGNSESIHNVTIPEDLAEKLNPGRIEELLRASFLFLLDQEPKESILSQFELPLIMIYYPEYETEVLEKFLHKK